MAFVDGNGDSVMEAVSNDDGPVGWRIIGLDPSYLSDGFFKIVDDLVQHARPGAKFDPPDYREQLMAAGYRSLLSVSLSARDQRFFLQFWSRQLKAFRQEQVPIARRIAAHVALAVSHEQLAEAARGLGLTRKQLYVRLRQYDQERAR